MSYVFGTDYISITDEVRELARSVVDSAIDFTDDEIIRYQFMSYSQIRTATDYDTWIPTDREYGALQVVETELAASYIIEHYGTAADIALWQSMRESAMTMLTKLVDNMQTDTGTAAGDIRQTAYKSWNLNTVVRPPNRLTNSVLTGFETEVDF